MYLQLLNIYEYIYPMFWGKMHGLYTRNQSLFYVPTGPLGDVMNLAVNEQMFYDFFSVNTCTQVSL